MSLALPQPAGLLRSKLETSLASLVPEADRDTVIIAVLRTMNDIGFSIQANGWLDDDEPLLAAFREQGLDSEGLPEDMLVGDGGVEIFLDDIDLDNNNSILPSIWPDDTGENG